MYLGDISKALLIRDKVSVIINMNVRPEKFQFLEKWQNRNFSYEIVFSVKNPKFIL